MRRLAYKIIGKNKISKESENLKIARDKGVTSSDWLGYNYLNIKMRIFNKDEAL